MNTSASNRYASIDLDVLGQAVADLEETLNGLHQWLPGLERDFAYFGVDTASLNRLGAAKRELDSVVPDLRERHRRAEILLVHQSNYRLHGEDGVVHFTGDLIDGNGHVSHQIHDQTSRPPGEVNQWWTGLGDDEKNYLTEYHPYLLGRLDGVPVSFRDQANRAVLAHEIERLRHELSRLINPPGLDTPLYFDGRPVPPTDPMAHLPRLQEASRLGQRLPGLLAIQERLERTDPPAYLIDFSTQGLGRTVISIGNPDEADNVGTYVPGTGSQLDERINTDIRRADIMFDDAHDAAKSSSTAVIMWLGYNAPQDVILDVQNPSHTAWSPSRAESAAPNLRRFQETLRVTHIEGNSHNTLLGHSYGTTVIGHAAKEGDIHVDNLVFIASPGVGVNHVSDLGVDAGHVFATTAHGDPILFTPDRILGTQPSSNRFGLHTIDGTIGPTYFRSNPGGHSSYWDNGNKARNNFAYIITGQYGFVR
ncbi:alpha/beta hydrolase [Phytoactinopolyspora limicola]|uniref:alpha/beta hydrolase n=1 Tax=Phytoactinopolyspora limicola TaxID=2715536 RepID=UPI00140B969C|nr:alpha/beta hydrolase [Phytoactinopolyspora limicola]